MKYQNLGSVIDQLLKNLGIEDQVLEHQAIALWDEIAGNNISKNTKAIRIEDGVLFVRVTSDAWKNELLFYKPELIQKLNEKIGKSIVRDIYLV
ncbi:MAG: DUF721 domain-containing protein [candidate division KSB1 bacterium]|jgi:predicted nucleic acid-binding Zn ribbon protein|nr:DUF721 domain-containing protein [candidate division KSB1 bacterium]